MSLPVLESRLFSPQCAKCAFVTSCGNVDHDPYLFDCSVEKCCGKGDCDEICPNKPDFHDRLLEVRGLNFDALKPVKQRFISLPQVIPHLPHRYCRRQLFGNPWVSLSPYEFLRYPNDECKAQVCSPAELRSAYSLRPDINIVFRGADKDKHLEKFWAYRRRDGVAEQFRNFGGALFIGPNYSHFGDVLRIDNLYNRMRQLICLEEMSEFGLNVVPHLNDAALGDWEFWLKYLRRNPTISIVAKELHTRGKSWDEGVLAVKRLAFLQDQLARDLHPIIIGGTRYVELIAAAFRSFTIIDCQPVQQGLHYYRFVPKGTRGRSVSDPHLPNIGPDTLIDTNIRAFTEWIAHRSKLAAGARHVRGRAG